MRVLKFLRMGWILAAFVVLVPVFATLSSPLVGATYATNITVGDVHSLANQERANAGLAALNYNSQLSSAAYGKANHMIANNYWAHIAPDGTTPWYFIQASGYSYTTAGENLAKDFSTSSGVVAGWMASPTHRANVVNSSYTDVGYAVMNGVMQGSETTLVVAMYGAQSAPEPAPALVVVPVVQSTTPVNNTPTSPVAASVEPVAAVSQPGVAPAVESASVEVALIVEQPSTVPANGVKIGGEVKATAESEKSLVVANNPEVLGNTSFLGQVYKSMNSYVKSLIIIVSALALAIVVRYIFVVRRNRSSNRYVWFKKQPIAGSLIMVALIALTTINGIGISL